MFWVDMCKSEANQLFLLYTFSTRWRSMTSQAHDAQPGRPRGWYDNLSGDTPAPTVVDGRYYTLNSPFMALLLVIYTLVPLYFILRTVQAGAYNRRGHA